MRPGGGRAGGEAGATPSVRGQPRCCAAGAGRRGPCRRAGRTERREAGAVLGEAKASHLMRSDGTRCGARSPAAAS